MRTWAYGNSGKQPKSVLKMCAATAITGKSPRTRILPLQDHLLSIVNMSEVV